MRIGRQAPRQTHRRSRQPVVFELVAPTEITGVDNTTVVAISRAEALQVPAVKRGRDMICSTLASLPVHQFNGRRQIVDSRFLKQPDPQVARVVTMAMTYEDLLFYGWAMWHITEFKSGFPSAAHRVDPRRITQDPDGTVKIDAKVVSDKQLIRFDSPNPGILTTAGSITTARKLDAMTEVYAEGGQPLGYFTPSDPAADPFSDEDTEAEGYDEDDAPTDGGVIAFLQSWMAARRKRSVAYVPGDLKYVTTQFNPEQLQLHEARQHAVLEIARLIGVDPEDLGVSTTSRTYQNDEQRRLHLLDFCLAAYIHAVEERLSMGDVTPRGNYVKVSVDGFLRSDTKSRYDAYMVGLAGGFLTVDQVLDKEDLPAQGTPRKVEVPTSEE